MRSLSLMAVWVVCGCSPGVDQPDTEALLATTTTTTGLQPVVVEVGNGERTHQALSDGDHVVLWHGAAGGNYVRYSAWVQNTGVAISADSRRRLCTGDHRLRSYGCGPVCAMRAVA